jgi:hypothetical protein
MAIIDNKSNVQGVNTMKKKLFRYGYLIRIGFEHGRFIPFLAKQRIVTKLIAGASTQVIELSNNLTLGISEMLFKANTLLIDLLSSNTYLVNMNLFGSVLESQVRFPVF